MSNKEKRIDPRVKRTRRLLRNALMKLIPEKGYNAITIQDITERATLNRATFYLHYRDKDDLLARGFDEIWNELTAENPLPVTADGSLSSEGTKMTILTDFEHFVENEEFYRVMLGEKGVTEFIHRLQDHVYETTALRLKTVLGSFPTGPVPIEMVLHFIASAYVGLIQWWLENDMPYDPEEMASFIVDLYSVSPFKAMGLEVIENQ
ncbi:MAG: TetR family transcriptional regulator [Anaerolineales bacterium]|nr:TetR family transcriptional regulator [Anaerolineales bacterium]